MGDPKRIRRKFDKPKTMWSKDRIETEHALKEKYGLKNLRELWQATTEVSRIRRNVRKVLSGASTEKEAHEDAKPKAQGMIVRLAVTPRRSSRDAPCLTMLYLASLADISFPSFSVAAAAIEKGVTHINIKIRAPGGYYRGKQNKEKCAKGAVRGID